ncbi:serine/threonine phosphatase [Stenomitos frigidus]|uniref:Serine/threonine protein phosphatase n=1 Tax=Stenomitos frigidus ULC18 TaxID=2107698 RepID=A0A2T1DVQ3_9CYAN|nr:serine/threonine phosphatase [Stenomitos frigidus]PSB24596.1 serine/threonine protein phosphatase [Stenomitos frigidus ULC18]
MLVCPQCQFENPNTNKFCQECGTSLTQNTCPECSSLVPFDVVQCQECGEIAGVIWWALMVDDQRRVVELPSTPAAIEVTADDRPIAVNDAERGYAYLDRRQRYRLLEVLPAPDGTNVERHVRVLDCQPFQMSLLEALAKHEADEPIGSMPIESQPDAIERADPTALAGNRIHSVQAMAVPAIAQPYLALGSKFHQALPVIHDAWQQDGQQIILLEDRALLPRLVDLWLDEDLALPALQLLHWLYEMVELWSVLDEWQACRSLLEIENLKVDEDQAICLQRLHLNLPDAPATLQDLGQLWQTLFAQSQRTQIGAIYVLLADLEAGKLETIADLRSRIEEIAHELQANQPETEMMPNLESFEPTDESVDDLALDSEPSRSSSVADLSTAAASTRLEVSLPEPTLPPDVDSDGDSDDLPTVVLPMQLFNLEDAGRTDIGRQRDHNEDYFGIETQTAKLESPSGKTVHARSLYILCDGMGGHAGGEVASALAVDTLRRYFKEKWQSAPFSDGASNKLPGPEVLIDAVQLANKAIYDVNQQNARSGSGRMGTTLVVLLVQDTEAAVAHVGDSRLYRYTRKRGLEQITIDHEVGQREIQRGVDPDIAYARPDAYQLTQALGPRDEHFIKPDIQYVELNEDTLLLLCSDGLTDNDLLETHWRTHVEPLLSSQANLEQGVSQLVELANQYNGHDNITAIAIRAKVRPNLDHLR